MKIAHTILALAVAGFLGHSAFGNDNSGLRLASVADGHGGNHSLYLQTQTTERNEVSVALCGSCGAGIGAAPAQNGNVDATFVQRSNGHGQTTVSYLRLAQAGQ